MYRTLQHLKYITLLFSGLPPSHDGPKIPNPSSIYTGITSENGKLTDTHQWMSVFNYPSE